MIAAVVEYHTREVRAGRDCMGLMIRDETLDVGDGGPAVTVMTTAWTPTPDELWLLANGGNVHVSISGDVHPAMAVQVGGLPTGTPSDPVTINHRDGWRMPPSAQPPEIA